MKPLLTLRAFAIALTLGASVVASSAQAATIGFDNILSDNMSGDELNGNFQLTVTDQGGSSVLFSIASAVNAGMTYFIGGIFVDDATVPLLSSLPLTNTVPSASVAYSRTTETKKGVTTNNPKNFPQGNNLAPTFESTATFLSDNSNGNAKAVQPGEVVSFLFGGSFASVIAGLTSGELRIGLHVQGIGNDSDSYVSAPMPAVPLPAAGFLLVGALGGLAAVRRRRRAA